MQTKFDQCVTAIMSLPLRRRIDRLEAEQIVEALLSKLLEENEAMKIELGNLDVDNENSWEVWNKMLHFIIDRDQNFRRRL